MSEVRPGAIIERSRDPGIACLVTAVHGQIVTFVVLTGEEAYQQKIASRRLMRVLVPAPPDDRS